MGMLALKQPVSSGKTADAGGVDNTHFARTRQSWCLMAEGDDKHPGFGHWNSNVLDPLEAP